MPEDRPPFHVTIKWSANYPRPEVMANLYAATPAELEEAIAAFKAIAETELACPFEAPGPSAEDLERVGIRPAAPAPLARTIRPEPEPRYVAPEFEDEPDDGTPRRRCGGEGHVAWRRSRNGGWFCAGRDQNEATGFCAWVLDDDGHMRRQAPQRRRGKAS